MPFTLQFREPVGASPGPLTFVMQVTFLEAEVTQVTRYYGVLSHFTGQLAPYRY